MPEGAVYVGRPTRWGNPYSVLKRDRRWYVLDLRGEVYWWQERVVSSHLGVDEARADAVRRYRRWLLGSQTRVEDLVPLLRGRDLACWCPLTEPCHADVLLETANGP